MATSSASGSVLPLSWADVLDNVSQMLRTAEAETLRSEQALDTPDIPAAETDKSPAYLDRLQERFTAMQDALTRAERVAVNAEAACQLVERAFTAWLAQAEATRRKLDTAAATGV
jgi:hypothetical protein